MQLLTQVMIHMLDSSRRLYVPAKNCLLKLWQIRCDLLFQDVDDLALDVFIEDKMLLAILVKVNL